MKSSNHTPIQIPIRKKMHYPSFWARVKDLRSSNGFPIRSGTTWLRTLASKIQLQTSKFQNPTSIAILLGGIFFAILGGIVFRNQLTTFFQSNKGAVPVAYWKLNEGEGTSVFDTQQSYNGTISNTLTNFWQGPDMCIDEHCILFDGSDDYVDVGAGPSGVKTVSFWARPASTSEYFIDLNGSAYISASSGTLSATGFSSPTIYVNGRESTTIVANRWQYITVTTSSGINATDLDIGRVEGSGYYQGSLDDIRIFDYERTAAQISAEYAGSGSVQGVSAQLGKNNFAERLSDGLVGYWKMDEVGSSGSNWSAADSSGNGNDGTGAGNATVGSTVPGKFGNAGFFDGNGDYVDVPNSSSIELNGEMTASFWFKTLSTGAGGVDYLLSNSVDNSNQNFTVDVHRTAQKLSTVWNNSSILTSNTTLSANTWYHVALVRSGSSGNWNVTFYVNGVNDGSTTTATNPDGGSAAIRIGGLYGLTGSNHEGSIDEVRVYSRALTSAEVQDLYEFSPSPIAHWKFDDKVSGDAQEILDSSGNNKHATTNNAGMNCKVSGKVGGACKFDGNNGYIEMSGTNLPTPTPAQTEHSLWSASDTPSAWEADTGGTGGITLGTNFQSSQAGSVTGVKFYKHSSNTGTHIGALYNSGGTKLAEVTFTGESGSGWQTAYFASPVAISADTTYTIAYFSTVGYSNDGAYFSSTYTNGILSASAGTYNYGGSISFPNNTWNNTNYWVDVIVETESGGNSSGSNNFDFDTGPFTINGWVKKPEMSIGSVEAATGIMNYVGFEGGAMTADSRGGFDVYDLAGNDNSAMDHFSFQSTHVRSGEYALQFDGDWTNDDEFVGFRAPDRSVFNSSDGVVWATFYLRLDSTEQIASGKSVFQVNLGSFNSGASNLYWLANSWDLVLYEGSGGTTSNSVTVTPDEWNKIEIKYDKGNSEVTLYVNDTFIDTHPNSSLNVSTDFEEAWFGNQDAVPGKYQVDDLVISEDRLDFEPSIVRMDVDGDGNSTDWDATDGYLNIDDVPDDGDTTYIVSSTSTNKQLSTLESAASAGVSGTVKAFKTQAVVRDTGGASNLATVVRINSTDYDQGEDVDPGNTYNSIGSILPTNPNTAAVWSLEDLNNIQIGVQNNVSVASRTTAVSGMVLLNNSISNRYILSQYDDDQGFKMWYDAEGALNFAIDDDSTWNAEDIVTSSSGLDDNMWHHFSVVKDNTSSLKLFIDGIVVSTDSSIAATGSLTSDSSIFNFGTDSPTASGYFDGVLDDFRVYNYPRTARQIIEDMNAGHPAIGTPVGSTVLHLKMDEGYGSTVADWSPQGNDGTLGSGDSAPAWTNDGKFGKALSFDGTNDYIRVFYDTSLYPENISVSTWVKPTAILTNTEFLDTLDATTGYRLRLNTNGTVLFQISGNDGDGVTSNTVLSTNEWYHIIGTYDGGSIKIYINGLIDNTSSSIDPIGDAGNNLSIGSYYQGHTEYFSGFIDDVRIYPFALSADQVKTVMNQGEQIVMGATSTGVGGTTPSYSAGREYCVPGDTSTCNAPVGEWTFDNITGNTAPDTSGNGNDGSINNSPLQVRGKVGRALKFDGSDDYVEIPDSNDLDFGTSTDFTVSFWAKMTGNSNADQDFFDKVSGSGFKIEYNGTAQVLQAYITDSGNFCTVRSTTDIEDGLWRHIVVVFNRNASCTTDDIQMYLDGKRETTTLSASSANTNVDITNANAMNLSDPTDYVEGMMDEVRIYNYARTPAQIAWEYNRGAPVAYYPMDECTGSIIYNHAKNGNGEYVGSNGTLTLGATGVTSAGTCITSGAWANGADGKLEASMSFDGTNDYIDLGSSQVFNTGKPFSLSLWTNTNNVPSGFVFPTLFAAVTNTNLWRLAYTEFTGFSTITFGAGSGWANSRVVNAVVEGGWHNIVITYNGNGATTRSNFKLYFDGIEQTLTTTGFFGTLSANTTIGNTPAASNHAYNGQIDEVKIFNYALTPEQVKIEMAGSAVRFE